MIVDGCERPSGLLRRCREAAEKSRNPKAYAAFVGRGDFRPCRNGGKREHATSECDPASPSRNCGVANLACCVLRHIALAPLSISRKSEHQFSVRKCDNA